MAADAFDAELPALAPGERRVIVDAPDHLVCELVMAAAAPGSPLRSVRVEQQAVEVERSDAAMVEGVGVAGYHAPGRMLVVGPAVSILDDGARRPEPTTPVARPASPLQWRDDTSFTVDGEAFRTADAPRDGDGLFVFKKRGPLERYLVILEGYVGANIVELGMYEGGSAALTLLVARPRHLLVADRGQTRAEALDRLVAERATEGRVNVRWGLDQGDRQAVQAAVVETFGDEPVDLVIDDASHRYAPTVVSLEVLLPRLRGGGELYIEDWHASYRYAARMKAAAAGPDARQPSRRPGPGRSRRRGPQPLHRLVCELALAARHRPDVVTAVEMDDTWATAVRGPARLDRTSFRWSDVADSFSGLLDS